MSDPVELDSVARRVIAAGRDAPVPNEFVAARLRRSVERALDGSGAGAARAKRRGTTLLVAFGAVAVGGALFATELVSDRPQPASQVEGAPRRVEATPLPRPVEAPAREPRSLEPSAPPAPVSPSVRPQAAQAPQSPRSPQLAAEIALLARANAAVNSGNGRRALELLAEYDRKFPAGALAQERAATSVLALCAAGRTREARAAADRFTRRWQRSPLSARVLGSCAGDK